ncbi:IS110 family transposase [Micromonospora sp. NPDC048999]|uniref:IS110 family transposase n=1 Tax=Micromonospora sp. NPDC048999 TaxID=3155391 RepID=UPI0033EB3650
MEEDGGQGLYVERIAALDLGKAVLEACVRLPHPSKPGRRVQEVRTYPTRTAQLLELADWLRCNQVTTVVMESTSDYWKGVYFLLEAEGFDCQVANAREVKNVPGRAKTDKADAVWLAKVAERGMFRPSLVHPEPIRRLRDFTRYRRSLVRDRSREKQRVEKLLEDAQIKLSSVISDIFGVSGRAMLNALAAGQRDPKALADLARASMRGKIAVLREALTGFFTDHHAVLLAMMLDNIDRLTAQITALEKQIEELVAPFCRQVEQLAEVPGVGRIGAAELIAEIGVDMTRFSTAAHLVSWAKFAPAVHESAGTKKQKRRPKGNPWLAATLGNAAGALTRSHTFLGARYRRIARRRGKGKAMVAVGNSMLTIAWHLLSDPTATFHDLGADYYETRINPERRARNLAAALQAVTGQKIVIHNSKAIIIETAAA